MKHLRKYNEAIVPIGANAVKPITGYSYDELVDIFKLNLEDNGKFDLSDIDMFVIKPSQGASTLSNGRSYSDETVRVVLSEYFGDHWDFSNTDAQSSRRSILDLNIKMLEKIARKYNLHFYSWSDWGSLTNHNIEFYVRKIPILNR